MMWDIRGLFGLGLVLLVIGAGVMVGSWPEVQSMPAYESLDIEATYTETGSELGVFIGAVMALLGQTMVAIAVIAVGVRIGINESRAVAPSVV